MSGRRAFAVVLIALAPLAAACGGSSGTGGTPEPAAEVRAVGAGAFQVTLSVETARRFEVRTAVVREVRGEAAVPYGSLLYAASGQAFVYVRTAPRTYQRRAVAVDRVAGPQVFLSGGLSPAERIATSGVAEIEGIELEAAGPGRLATSRQAFDPSAFGESATVDNPWLPLTPGTQLVFEGKSNDGARRLVFTVTDLVKTVGGVRNAVVWDRDYVGGELVEAELAFFAQDDLGNVWHTGEYPEEYENGKIVKTPAWLVGVQGARAGVEMPAEPRRGLPVYEQGYAPPPVNWTDHAQVYGTGAKTCVPVRCYGNVLIIREFNPGDPGSQLKYFAPGVGNIRVGWLGKDPDRETLRLAKLARLDEAGLASARGAALALEARAYRLQKGVYGATPQATPR